MDESKEREIGNIWLSAQRLHILFPFIFRDMNKQKFYWFKDNRYLYIYIYIEKSFEMGKIVKCSNWYRYFLYLKNKRRRITKDYIVLHGILDHILCDTDFKKFADIKDYKESEFGDFI